MKAKLKSTKIEVAIQGDGGYQNQSSLTLVVEGLGVIALPDPWDLTPLLGRKILGFTLGIPAGVLTTSGPVHVFPSECENLITLKAEKADWDGKQGGLFGGLSGYGSFDYGEICSVVQGTYMLPEDVVRIFGLPQRVPLDFSVDYISHCVTWAKYSTRHFRTLNAVGYTAAHEDAAIAAGILRTPKAERSPDDDEFLEQFHEGLRLREALTEEGFLLACTAHRAATTTLTDELPTELEEHCKSIHHQLSEVTPLLASHVSVLAAGDGTGPSAWIVGGGQVRVVTTDQDLIDLLNTWEKGQRVESRRQFAAADPDYFEQEPYEDYD